MANLKVVGDFSYRSTDGSFLDEILKAEKLYGGGEDVDLEEAAVDLVFGDQLTDDIRVCSCLTENSHCFCKTY